MNLGQWLGMPSRRLILKTLAAGAILGPEFLFPKLALAGALRSKPLTRIGFGSCLNQNYKAPILDAIIDRSPDLFVWLGDNVYGDVSSGEMNELVGAYAAQAARPDYRRLRGAVPALAVWDDHDYGFNDAGADFPYKAQAKALFAAFFGIPPGAERLTRDGVYDAQIIGPNGRRVQIILLDIRSFKSPWKPTDAWDEPSRQRYVPDEDPVKTMLGEAQWAWLEAQLRMPGDLRILVSSIQVVAQGHGFERWGNFPREKKRLYDVIRRSGATNLVALSGDRHLGALYREARAGTYPLYEMTTSSLNQAFVRNPPYPEVDPNRIGERYHQENFGVIDIDWGRRALTMSLHGIDGAAVREQTVAFSELS